MPRGHVPFLPSWQLGPGLWNGAKVVLEKTRLVGRGLTPVPRSLEASTAFSHAAQSDGLSL